MDAKRKFSDILLLYAARALRGFGDGFAIIVLPAYLAAIGFNAAQIGLVAAAALLGTALFTLAVGLSGAALRLEESADRRRGFDDLHRPGVSAVRGRRLSDRGGVFRHHQSLDRRHRRADSARARHADRRRCRPRAHAHLRALQPDRRAVDGGWRARRGRAGFPGRCRLHAARRVPGDVLRLCRSGARQRRDLRLPAARPCRAAAAGRAAEGIARRRL